MVGKISRADLAPIMEQTSQTLHTLKTKIAEEVSLVNPEEVDNLVRHLQKTINSLSREVNTSVTITPIDPHKQKSLFKLIQEIQHTPAFSQALGPHQAVLMGLFHRIENNLRKAQSKVERVDMDPMNP